MPVVTLMNLRRLYRSSAVFVIAVALTAALAAKEASSGQPGASQAGSSPQLARDLGISFPDDSASSVLLSRDGKQYLIDTKTKSVREVGNGPSFTPVGAHSGGENDSATVFAANCAPCHGRDGGGIKAVGTPNFRDPAFVHSVSAQQMQGAIEKGKNGRMPAWSGRLSERQIADLVAYVRSLSSDNGGQAANSPAVASNNPSNPPSDQSQPNIYKPGDDLLISLPTGKPTDRHGVVVNFTHRFPYDTSFTGTARGAQLFGLDDVALPSFGFRYGITDRLSVSAYRSPSLINRPIQLMAGYNLLEEQKDDPFNLMVRVSVEGQDNFQKNYTENIEAILSRSFTSKAQLYVVPTFSFNDRQLIGPSGFRSNNILNVPGVNAISMGVGVAVDVRPSVALLAEIIPTLLNARQLDIHRPVLAFGIEKKIWRHAFTLGFTTSPGTTVSQRAATRASFLGDPSADHLGGFTIGFDLMRQIH